MSALANSFYDITQAGWDIVASPRHADVVTVTGPITDAMRGAALETLKGTPSPRIVVAIGDCAANEGPWKGAPASGNGAAEELGAEVIVRGCPPTPEQIKGGLREAARHLGESQP